MSAAANLPSWLWGIDGLDGPPQSKQPGSLIPPVPLIFKRKECAHFSVEYARNGDDMIYHFFPPGEGRFFPDPNFATSLERGFVNSLPADADVRANYVKPEESAMLLRFDEDPNGESRIRESYDIRAVGLAGKPGAEIMLGEYLFKQIVKAIEES